MSGGGAPAVLLPPLYPLLYEPLVRRALEEDLGRAGDLTSDAILPPDLMAEARVVARAAGRIAGLPAALSAFRLLDPSIRIQEHAVDGQDVEAGTVLATVQGPARSILSAERTALNLLGRLCGIATATRDMPALVAPHGAHIVCTRKTTPGLRALEKYAVRCGGGHNHRFGLDDAVLIKDNHVALAGGIRPAVERARRAVGHLVKIEVEVDSLDQLREALDLGADVVLLDNMSAGDAARGGGAGQGEGDHGSLGGNQPQNCRGNRRDRGEFPLDGVVDAQRAVVGRGAGCGVGDFFQEPQISLAGRGGLPSESSPSIPLHAVEREGPLMRRQSWAKSPPSPRVERGRG